MKYDNYIKVEFPSKSCNEAFARTTAGVFAAQLDPTLEELGDSFSDGSTLEQAVDAKLLDEAINHFVCALPDDIQTAFVGRYYFFDSLKDIAGYCGMKESKLKSLLYRTRQQLKSYLVKEGFDV